MRLLLKEKPTIIVIRQAMVFAASISIQESVEPATPKLYPALIYEGVVVIVCRDDIVDPATPV